MKAEALSARFPYSHHGPARVRKASTWLVAVLGLFLAAWLLLIPASAFAAPEHVFKETFGSSNQPSFSEAEGLAVDQSSGDLLVIDGEANTVSRFNPDGTPAEISALGTNVLDGSETPQGSFEFGTEGEVQVAVDNSGGTTDGNIYVTQAAEKLVDIFAEDGSFLGQLTESSEGAFGEPCGVAVDPSGNVYVGQFAPGEVHKFEPSGSFPVNGDSSANFAFERLCTLAAGAGATNGFIFPAPFHEPVSKLDSATGEEKYVVAPGETTTETVDPASGHLYIAAGSEVKEYDASGATEATLLSSFSVPALATGIAVSEATGNVYVARSGNSQIEVWGPAVALPDATTGAASVVGANVTLHGAVNAVGPPATCVFEYVEVKAEGFEGATSVPCSPAGPFTGTSGVSVSAQVNGLPEASFRYRLVASSENGAANGETGFFNTFERLSGLPDGRAYEMVSPPQKAGEVLPPEPGMQLGGRLSKRCPVACLPGVFEGQMPMQSAPDGEAIIYEGEPFSSGLAAKASEYLSKRSSSGWKTKSLTPEPFETGFANQGYKGLSADLSLGVQAQTQPALSPEAPSEGEGKDFANLYLVRSEDGALQPLVTVEPPNREPGFDAGRFRILYRGANAGTALTQASSHVVLEANDALTDAVPGVAPAAPEVEGGEECGFAGANCNLYEWVEGELRLVNVLPGNLSTASSTVIGSGRLLAGGSPQSENPDVENAISADGSRIFWSNASGQVYVRIDGEETREIDDPGKFVTASADGSEVLLSDGCLYDLEEEECEDLTLDEGKVHKGGFEGILGTGEDGAGDEITRVYFVDTEVLTGENAEGKSPVKGKFNLYTWQEGVTTFIGTLLAGDNNAVPARFGDWRFPASNRTAQASADGRYLAFMSAAPLTGYDNEVRNGGCSKENGPVQPCFEVFEYDAASEQLSCASCNPSGQRPLGQSNLSAIRPPFSYPIGRQLENLPVNGEGTLFFESQDELSPHDTNGAIQDVYEWKPQGVGGCERSGGCVALISSGHASNDSMFLDSAPSGKDSFFITREQLVPSDKDEQMDVYDARVGGGFEEATGSCSGKGCKTLTSSAPSFGRGSAEFRGPGNPPRPHRCKPGFVRKHGKCAKKKPKKHHVRHERNRGKHKHRAKKHQRKGS